MDSNKYYWMRLYTDFFEQPAIRYILSLKNADSIIVIMLKLSLMSVKYDGVIRVSDTMSYSDKNLSRILGIKLERYSEIMNLFVDLDLISITNDDSIIMNLAVKATGKETSSARRKRDQRARDSELLDEIANKINKLEPYIAYKDYKASRLEQGKKEIIPLIWMTDEEYDALCSNFDEDIVDEKLSELSEWIEMKGVYYEDHYRTIIKWINKDY
jgi:predicted phage replisome organizer